MNRFALCLSVIMFCSASALGQSGSLKVTSFPSGAQVTVDGVNTGKTTPMSTSLSVGDHTVTVSIPNSGWNPDTRTVTIASGNNDLSVTLLPMLTTGPQGPQGPAGPTGPQGPAGASPFFLNGSDAVYTQGNVGIGTITPFQNPHTTGLHLGSDGSISGIKTNPASNLHWFLQSGDGIGPTVTGYVGIKAPEDASISFGLPDPAGYFLIRSDFKTITLDANGGNTRAVNLTPEGNVGIGTAAPGASLHVRDGIVGGRGSLLVEATAENAYYNLQANAAGANNFATLVKLGPTQGAGTAGTLKLNNSGSSFDNHLVISTNGNIGIGTTSPSATLHVIGNFIATGTKSTVVALPNDRTVALYAVESPENWFEDFGSGKLIEGMAQIVLDPTFAHTVNTEITYHVFLTPNAECRGLYVAQKSPGSFEVRELGGGKSNITFDYRIVARRKGYEGLRLPKMPENR